MYTHHRLMTMAALSLSLLAAAPLGATPKNSQEKSSCAAQKAPLPKSVRAALDSGNYALLQQKLIEALRGAKITPNNAAALRLADMLEIVRVTSPEVLTAYAADADHAKFLKQFMTDQAWQELYLGCGLVPFKTDVGINVLYRIWKDRGGKVENKPLAVALASVWGGGETAPNPAILKTDPTKHNPVWRYNFFLKQAAKGLLHPNYKNLQPWELRFTVGIPAQDWDDGSFAFCAENIDVPPRRLGGACWVAGYADTSKFGDSVQSGEYLLPYPNLSRAEATYRNGGVCGSLSHLGTVNAMAHGVPAFTVGQPGHCAYAIRLERGHWEGAYMGPDGGMHNHIFGNRAPDSFLLMEAVFGDDKAIRQAYRQATCARALEACGQKQAARHMWEKALASSPLHPFFRRELHRLMKEEGLTPDACFAYLDKTIPLYSKNGYSALDMTEDLKDCITKMTDEQKLKLYTALHSAVAGTPCSPIMPTSPALTIDKTLADQCDTLNSPEQKEKLIVEVLRKHMAQGDGRAFGKTLEWVLNNYLAKGNEEGLARIFKTVTQNGLKPTGDEKADKEQKNKLVSAYNKCILAAENANSLAAFQSMSDAVEPYSSDEHNTPVLKKPDILEGQPVSEKKLLFRLSQTSRWDRPDLHRSLMSYKGGLFHTSKEQTPYAIVQLDKPSDITGVLLRKHSSNTERIKKVTVYTSADGATWMKRAEINDMPMEWAVPFPEGTQGKWIKVEFNNSAPEFAHLSHFIPFVK